MNMRLARNHTAAFSMLELIVATAMLTTVMASIVGLVRTSYSAWESHERDLERQKTSSRRYGTLSDKFGRQTASSIFRPRPRRPADLRC